MPDAWVLIPGMNLWWMLVMTQMSAGAMLAATLAFWAGGLTLREAGITGAVAWGIGLLGINLSVLHLGQPLKAWRAFLGWRKSWLSREIISFGAYAGAGTAVMAAWWWGNGLWMKLAMGGAALAGMLAVWASVMVYVDTRRPFWSLPLTAGKFFGTTLLLGTGLAGVTWAWQGAAPTVVAITGALCFRWTLSLWEMAQTRRARRDAAVPWHRSAQVLTGLLGPQQRRRQVLLGATGVVLPLAMLLGAPVKHCFLLSLGLTFASQLIERRTFFTAAAGPRMPGS
jgi:formate dehydrogenase iron-sulfur subunit